MRYGYKASAEQFGSSAAARPVAAGRGARPRDHRRLRPLPALAPPRRACPGRAHVARRAGCAQRRRARRHERADADDALPPVDRRAVVRDARAAHARPGLPRHRHRRGDERDARDGRGVAGREGAPAAAGRVDRADPPPVDRGARRLRGRLLPHRARDPLRAPRGADPDLRRRRRPARRQARRPHRRRLHLHQRQADGALHVAARERRGGRRGRGPRPGRHRADDRDQGLLRHRARARRARVPLVGRAGAHVGGEDCRPRTRSSSSGSPTPTPSAPRRASSSPPIPTRWSTASRRTSTSASPSSSSTGPATDQERFLELFTRDVLPRLRARFG